MSKIRNRLGLVPGSSRSLPRLIRLTLTFVAAERAPGWDPTLTLGAAHGGDVLGLVLVVSRRPAAAAAVVTVRGRRVVRIRHCCVFEFHQQRRAAMQIRGDQVHLPSVAPASPRATPSRSTAAQPTDSRLIRARCIDALESLVC